MRLRKCRISVFCILFLVLFLFGTICGVLLFRLLSSRQGEWVLAYGQVLAGEALPESRVFSWLRPLAVVLLMGIVPWGRRFVPVLIVLRGLLMAYFVSMRFACGQSLEPAVLRGAAMLPLFFAVSLWTFHAFPQEARV